MNEPKLPEYLTEHEDGSVSVRFKRPVQLGGVEVSEIRLRELTVADQIAASRAGKGVEVDVMLICNLSEAATPDEVKALPSRAFNRLQDGLRLFLD